MYRPIRAAVVQATPALFDLWSSLDRVEQFTQEASSNGAELVLFPESFLPAYPRGLGFGTVVGSRSASGREDWLLYHSNAVEIPSPEADRLGQIAARYACWLVIGVTERARLGGSLYCSILYFNPEGQLLHRHRKLKPTAAERIVWGEGLGDDLQVINTPFGKMGGLICWENYMPLARMSQYQQGIDIYLAPTADHRSSWTASMQHIALEGRCYVLAANQFVRKADYPQRFQEELADQPEIMSRGGSLILSPLGEVLAGPLWDRAGILYTDINPEEIQRSKLDFDATGHYQRKDVFAYHWLKDKD